MTLFPTPDYRTPPFFQSGGGGSVYIIRAFTFECQKKIEEGHWCDDTKIFYDTIRIAGGNAWCILDSPVEVDKAILIGRWKCDTM